MRVLILSAAVLACATAAPSGAFLAPIAPFAYSAVAIPAVVPTIPPGDIQAAAIDAKVQVEDLTRAAADRARELAEQAIEQQDEGVIEANNLAKERAEESFWAAEERKWQAMDALKTAEAQVDGSIASMAGAVAKAAYGVPGAVIVQPGVVQNVGAVGVVGEVKSALVENMAEEKKEVMGEVKAAGEEKAVEEMKSAVEMKAAGEMKADSEVKAEVKSVEAESKPVEKEMKAADSVQVEAAKVDSVATVKSAEAIKEEGAGFVTLKQTHPLPVGSAAIVAQPWLNQGFAPISYVPGLRTYVPSVIPNYSGHLLNPAYFKAAW